MSDPKKLSIITVCLNLQGAIRKTCESVVQQTWRDFEWIMVDGASTDGTLEILAEYRDRIDILISEKDTGIYNAMNKGIRAASGEWLLFLNGGDRLASDTVLEKVFGGGERDADVLYGNTLTEYGDKIVGNGSVQTVETITPEFFVRETLNHQSTFARRNLFDRYGLYDESFRIAADYDKWILFAKSGCRFEKIDLFVAAFNMDGISSSRKHRRLVRREKATVLGRYFSRREIAEAGKAWKKKERYLVTWEFCPIFGRTSLFSVKKSPDGLRTKYCLFGLQLLKLRKMKQDRSKVYIFGGIPIWVTSHKE